jgi:hypothetical protein
MLPCQGDTSRDMAFFHSSFQAQLARVSAESGKNANEGKSRGRYKCYKGAWLQGLVSNCRLAQGFVAL